MSNTKAVTDTTFDKEVLTSPIPVLVDFWAEWCTPCKMMAPVLDQLASEKSSQLTVVKLDVDSNTDIAGRYNVMSIPTLILFKGGQPVERLVGYMPKERLLGELAEHLA